MDPKNNIPLSVSLEEFCTTYRCAVCLLIFVNTVILNCGHSFVSLALTLLPADRVRIRLYGIRHYYLSRISAQSCANTFRTLISIFLIIGFSSLRSLQFCDLNLLQNKSLWVLCRYEK